MDAAARVSVDGSTTTDPGGDDRRRLGDLLVADGAISGDQLEQALDAQRDGPTRRRLGDVLRELQLVSESDVATALARQLGLPLVDLDDGTVPSAEVLELVPRRLAEQHTVLPVDLDPTTATLTVAVADPTNVFALDDLRATRGVRSVRMLVAEQSAVQRAVVRAYEQGAAGRVVEDLGEVRDAVPDDEVDLDAGDEPVVRLVNALLADAVRSRASDVHVEPEQHGVRVRFRVDGMLRVVQEVPRGLAPAVTSRLKIISKLDIAERRRPQDGRATVRVDGEEVDLRVSTMPSMFGETTVLRLLRKGAQRLELDDLGLDDEQRRAYETAIGRTQGLVVLTGPTGSGKTTSLYAGLAHLTAPERNIVTLEDPVEYQLPGVNQTQVTPRVGLTFAAGLRTVLRQDPDVIMVGEVRDEETARLAVEASFTGHLVLSTLHTNDAPSTVARLTELGVERFLLATTLQLVVAQRLARVVCDACAEPTTPDADVLAQLGVTEEELAGATPRRGAGCGRCERTGFRGRTALYEFLVMSPRLRQLVSDGGTELQVGALARAEGLRSLREDGITKALAGRTTFEEVLRVTPDDQFRTAGDPTEAAVRVGALQAATLLAVGDDALVAELAAALPQGWTLESVGTASGALQSVAELDPDLIVVREQLPDGAALDMLRPLRQRRQDHTPVVVRAEGPAGGDLARDEAVLGVTDRVEGEVSTVELRARLEAALPHG